MTKNFLVIARKCQTLVWLALPMALVAGCASGPGRTAADRAASPESHPRQVADNFSPSPLAVDVGVRDEGVLLVAGEQAVIGREIFEMMLADKSYHYPLMASVDKWGFIRLSGTSLNGVERQRMVDRMWELPGVTGVEDGSGREVAHTVVPAPVLVDRNNP